MIPAIPEASAAATPAAPRPRAGTAPDLAPPPAAASHPPRGRKSVGGAALRISMPDIADLLAPPGNTKTAGVAARRVSAFPAPSLRGPCRSLAAPENAQELGADDSASACGSSGGCGNGGSDGAEPAVAQGPYLAYLLDLVLAPTSGWQAGSLGH